MSRSVKDPGPDHPISISKAARKIDVIVDGEAIVSSIEALSLAEARYPLVHYLPRSAAQMDRLVRSETTSWCPYKGEASYYHIRRKDGSLIKDALWTYETPHGAVSAIKDYLAAYPDRVDAVTSE